MDRLNVFIGMLLLIVFTACEKDDTKQRETVLYKTNFSEDDGNWWIGESQGQAAGYLNDQYWLAGRSITCYSYLNNVFPINDEVTAVEASVKLEYITNSDYGFGGILWNYKKHSDDDYNYFVFQISYNGYWILSEYSSTSGWTDHTDWSLSNIVRKNDFNNLRIVRSPDKIRFYINNTEVYNMSTTGHLVLDKMGLYANGYSKLTARSFKAYKLSQ